MTRARIVRWVVIGVCAVGIAGMIVGSVAGHNDVALSCGRTGAAGVRCLMVATAVTPPATPTQTAADTPVFDERQAARVEQLVERLVLDGAREAAVRELVGEAVR